MFVLLHFAFHKEEFWWYRKSELVVCWDTCIWRQGRGFVPGYSTLSLAGFVSCPKSLGGRMVPAELLGQEGGFGELLGDVAVSELISTNPGSPCPCQGGRAKLGPELGICCKGKCSCCCVLTTIISSLGALLCFGTASALGGFVFVGDSPGCFRIPQS